MLWREAEDRVPSIHSNQVGKLAWGILRATFQMYLFFRAMAKTSRSISYVSRTRTSLGTRAAISPSSLQLLRFTISKRWAGLQQRRLHLLESLLWSISTWPLGEIPRRV